MRRKDGKPKRKALRAMPTFDRGFCKNPETRPFRHPSWDGERSASHYSCVSLFAGCGGLDLGLSGGFKFLGKSYKTHPFDIVYAVDNSADAVEAYRLNLGDHIALGDLTSIDMSDVPRADVLMGGFPCQDFSSSGPKVGLAGKRGKLYTALADYMATHRPMIVIAENVPHLARLRGGVYLHQILKDFEAEGYSFDVWDLFAPDFGLPQSRRRLFLIGVRDDLKGRPSPPPPVPSAYTTVDQALHDLESVTDETVTNQSQYFVASRATAGGGQGDHTNKAGDVAYCIRANARGRIQFHYSLPRRLTVRECARLQSFPDEFVFPFSTQRNLTLIGNAVPPILGHQVARAVFKFLRNHTTGSVGASDHERDARNSDSYICNPVRQLDLFARPQRR